MTSKTVKRLQNKNLFDLKRLKLERLKLQTYETKKLVKLETSTPIYVYFFI